VEFISEGHGNQPSEKAFQRKIIIKINTFCNNFFCHHYNIKAILNKE
jgi:hypothetical protein